MQIETIKFIMPQFSYSDGRPAANIYIHLDILGDDEIRYQHFNTNQDGKIFSGEKPAMVREGEYDLCATRNDVHDDFMEEYKPFHITIKEGSVVQIPEDIVLEWAWGDVHEHIQSLEETNRKLGDEMDVMKKQVEVLEKEQMDSPLAGEDANEERVKIQNIYNNIEIAKKKIEENWDLVEKGKTKLKVLLDKQEDTLAYLEQAEIEKEELKMLKRELEEKKRQIDLIFKAIVGGEFDADGVAIVPGEGVILDDEYMDGFYTDPDIETLQRIKEHIFNINEKRKQLEVAKEKILEARRQLKDRKDGMTDLSEEMKETIRQYDQLLNELQEEKEKLATIKEKLGEGWDRLKNEYSDRVREVETKFRIIEKERVLLAERKDQIKEFLEKGREHILEEHTAFRDQSETVKDHLLTGKDRVMGEKTEIMLGKEKLAALGTDLRKHSGKIKEAVIAKQKFEEKFDALREDETALAKRETALRREQRKMDRDHSLRMEAYAQNDSDIEDEFTALDEMRELMSGQREDFVKDRLEFLKESMSYECPICGGTIPVKSAIRPLRVQCPSCTNEFNLKPKQKYQCPECSDTITVTNTKRPISVKCQKCASEFIIRKPFPHEEDIIPDRIKARVPAN